MSRFLSGANRTAQYYQGEYPSSSTFSRLDKCLIHTTETRGWPGYSGGASAPNATYFPERREIRQHFDNNRSARALRDPSGTAVRENRDNIFQLEVICYSSYSLVERFGGLWVGDLTDTHMRDIAEIINQLHRDWDVPLRSSVTWREGRRTFYDDVRLSGRQFDAYRGILGHVHASGNSHWDPGGFRYSRLARHFTAADQEDDDMAAMDHKRFTDLMIWASRDSQVQRNLANATVSRMLAKEVTLPDGRQVSLLSVLVWGYVHAAGARSNAAQAVAEVAKVAGLDVADMQRIVDEQTETLLTETSNRDADLTAAAVVDELAERLTDDA